MKKLFYMLLVCAVGCSLATGQTAITESFFGADFNGSSVWPPTDGEHQIGTLGGLRLWDNGVKWAHLNTAPGVYNWQKIDNWIAMAQGQGMDVLYTFGYTPDFAGTYNTNCLDSDYSCTAPKDVNADGTGTDKYFSDFVTALVTRYKGRIAFYELWNEPDFSGFWSGTTAQLVRMGKDAAKIIRSIDPGARILSPSAHGPTMATFFDSYVAAGGAGNFDIVNAHLRGQGQKNANPEAVMDMYNDVVSEVKKRNLTKLPIWDDEHGLLQGQLSDPDMMAGHVARGVLLRAGLGIQRQYIYTWDNPMYGMQGNDSGTAWDVVAGWLIWHTISPCVEKGTVYTCLLDHGLAVWDTAQSCSQGVCTSSKYAYPAGYKYQTDLQGRKSAVPGSTVSIGYKPILLTQK
jgi:hypothetical protein